MCANQSQAKETAKDEKKACRLRAGFLRFVEEGAVRFFIQVRPSRKWPAKSGARLPNPKFRDGGLRAGSQTTRPPTRQARKQTSPSEHRRHQKVSPSHHKDPYSPRNSDAIMQSRDHEGRAITKIKSLYCALRLCYSPSAHAAIEATIVLQTITHYISSHFHEKGKVEVRYRQQHEYQ